MTKSELLIYLTAVALGLVLIFSFVQGARGQTQDAPARQVIQRAAQTFQRATNFSAAVDVDTIDRQSAQPQSTRAKEAWKFSRVGGTNLFTRTRFTPVPGLEMIEATNYAGGRLVVGPSSVPLPEDASLPGFETLNLLADLLAAGPVVERKEAGSLVVSAKTRAGLVLKAWFPEGRTMPSRIEKHRDGNLVFALTRTDAGSGTSILPLRDSLHFYENGRITTTVLRSFAHVDERPPASPTAPAATKEK